MSTLTKQEGLFFDRVALKMKETPTLSIEAAAQLVLDDDVRILNRFVHLRHDELEHLTRGLCSIVYDAIKKQGQQLQFDNEGLTTEGQKV